jgi:hypothetical protein
MKECLECMFDINPVAISEMELCFRLLQESGYFLPLPARSSWLSHTEA